MNNTGRFTLALMLGLLGALTVSPLAAQAPSRDGFFIGFGFGYGSLGVEGGDERTSSASGFLALGGALNDRILLGGESNAWVKEESGVTLTVGSVNAVVYVYPTPGGPFFLKGGLGFARVEVDTGLGSGDEGGVGVQLGAGYDIGFGGRFAVTPFGNFLLGSFDGGNTNILQLGLGVHWY